MDLGLPPDLINHLLESIHDGILIADANSIVRYVNAAYTRITGVSRNQIVGKRLRDVRPGAKLPDVIRTGKPMLGVLRQENGVDYVVDMFPIVQEGRVIGGVSIVFDITQVKRLSRELARSEMLLEGLRNRLSEVHSAKRTFDDIVGRSEALRRVVELAKKAAEGDAPVLISGATGTGKELFAEAIHNASPRASGPFVAVNCACLPANLLESELFGYTEGSFTGARKGGKAGLFQTAHRGTIFLDEVGELPLDLQAKLLRVIQNKRVRPIGSTDEVEVDVRIVSATNRKLEDAVRRDTFREDLYFRLNVLRIDIPPLSERTEDIPELVEHILDRISSRWGYKFVVSQEAMALLLTHDWPGNVRELENALEYAVHMAGRQPIRPEHLPESVVRNAKASRHQGELARVRGQAERDAIMALLLKHGFSVQGKRAVARELGISLATLYNRLREYGIRSP